LSEIRATTISDAAGTGPITLTGQSAAKAWVNFDGTGTIATRDSFNVASLTDNGTGNYTVNLTSSMSNTSYSITTGGDNYHTASVTVTVGSFTVLKYSAAHSNDDASKVYASIDGDLA
jgi:hypothetical protein